MTSRLLIRNGILAQPEGPMRADILCEGPRIAAVARGIVAPDAVVVDAAGLTVGPGFVDLHVHGGGGFSFFDPYDEDVAGYGAWAPRNGVTSFLVSTLSSDAPRTEALLRGLAPAIGLEDGAEALGFHLEGPFINPLRKGAFAATMLRTVDPAEWLAYQEAASGKIRLVTLAPELPGAEDLITAVTRSDAVAAMGHTDATAAQARRGFEAGVRHVTHLFNAMRPIHQRDPGPAVAALLERGVTCELICDQAHVAPEMMRLAFSLLGPQRMVVVTDNLALSGTEDAKASFGGQPISRAGPLLLKEDGTITGSTVTMDEHFRNVVETLHIDLGTAFRLCSANAARVIGVERRKGALQHGFDADIVLLDSELRVVVTVCRGLIAYDARFEGGPAGRR